MIHNLHAYRDLGVPCIKLSCVFCGRKTVFGAYFETDAERRKRCSLGCCECGRGGAVSEQRYDELYELRFEFDRLQSGEISGDAFERCVSDTCRDLFRRRESLASGYGKAAAPAGSQSSPEATRGWFGTHCET